ncbi:GGDEF domain-containing protein [Vibrio tritonius]|uniref:GGDEF domain-containing protein n=1 Tax=Vibrio tritonius TaxID=1435069 RepID=UPI000838F5DA
MDAKLFDHSHTIRASLLSGVSLFSTAVSACLALFYLIQLDSILTGAIHLVFCAYSLHIYFLAKKNQHTERNVRNFVYLIILIITYGNACLPLDNYNLLWITLCPLLMYALLGRRHGFYASIAIFVLQLCILGYRVFHVGDHSVAGLLVNLISSYCTVWLISHIYEGNRRDVEQTLSSLASRDALTSTHNRLALTTAFGHFERHRHDESLSLLIIDLDFFKSINDRYGHDVGDKVLIETSQLIMQIVGDDNLYRIGGEEFCVTLFNQSVDHAETVGERIRHLVASNPYVYNDQHIHLTLSVGICSYQPGHHLGDLLRMADKELYRAKECGRNQVRLCSVPKEELPTTTVSPQQEAHL